MFTQPILIYITPKFGWALLHVWSFQSIFFIFWPGLDNLNVYIWMPTFWVYATWRSCMTLRKPGIHDAVCWLQNLHFELLFFLCPVGVIFFHHTMKINSAALFFCTYLSWKVKGCSSLHGSKAENDSQNWIWSKASFISWIDLVLTLYMFRHGKY